MRIGFEGGADGPRIVIPHRRSWFALIFLGIWLCGWLLGLGSSLQSMRAGQSGGAEPLAGDSILWGIFWTVGGALALYIWLWNLGGREVISIERTSGELVRRREIFGVGVRQQRYALERIRDVRLDPAAVARFSATGSYGLGPGSVQFDEDGKTRSLGLGLDQPEAVRVVEALRGASGGSR